MDSFLDTPTLEEVLKFWNLPGAQSLLEVPVGAVNKVYKIETPASNYFLRVYRTQDVDVIRREQGLISHVHALGVPAVLPLKTRQNQFYAQWGGRFVTVSPEVNGEQISRNTLKVQQAKAAGDMLAKIHQGTESLKNTGFRVYNLKWSLQEVLRKLESIEEIIQQREHATESDEWALRRLQRQRLHLQTPQSRHDYETQTPSQVLHGDYHYGNIFFSADGQVSGVIDWDQAVYMPRSFELVRAAYYMFSFESEACLEFFKAYLELNPLSLAELEDGVRAWSAQSDHYTWAIEEVYLKNNERARFFIPHEDFRPFAETWGIFKKLLSL